MKVTRISSSLTILEHAAPAELATMEAQHREQFVETCRHSSETRPPTDGDLNHWWKRTQRRSDA